MGVAPRNSGYGDTVFPAAEAHPLGGHKPGHMFVFQVKIHVFHRATEVTRMCGSLGGRRSGTSWTRGHPTARPSRASCRTGHPKVRALRTGGHPAREWVLCVSTDTTRLEPTTLVDLPPVESLWTGLSETLERKPPTLDDIPPRDLGESTEMEDLSLRAELATVAEAGAYLRYVSGVFDHPQGWVIGYPDTV